MDTENLPASETPMERKLEAPEESTQPENPAAAEGEAQQQAVNGHETPVANLMETEELIVATPEEQLDTESVPPLVTPSEPDESSEKASDPVEEPENSKQQAVPENAPEPVQSPLAESAPETQPDAQAPIQEPEVSGPVEAAMATEEAKAMVSSEAAVSKEEVPAGNVQPAGDEKGVASDTPVEPTEAGDVKSEPAEKEEDPAPASGSLAFALLEQEKTKDALMTTRTLVVLRGLPGSGKSFLARAIADAYKDNCSVICADDHGILPESPDSSAAGFKALDEAVVARCSDGTTSSLLVVVDDTNHTHDRVARLEEIAEQHRLITIFLEPQTEWGRDPAQLSKKTKRGLQAAKLETMKASLEETPLPLFFGWFLQPAAQDKVKCTALDFEKTLDTLEAFKKHLIDFTGKPETEVDLEQYFKPQGALHCTTQFCDYGKAEGAKEYAQNPAVKESYGSVFELSLSALFVTPRTAGARVSLTEEQLLLWPANAEKDAASVVPAAATMPLGSRAHVTLGCADGVEAVQTGLDLLEILSLQPDGQQGEPVEMELGSLYYYGAGRWLLNLREPICVPAFFSSFYGRKAAEAPKPEKKKKPKCTIL